MHTRGEHYQRKSTEEASPQGRIAPSHDVPVDPPNPPRQPDERAATKAGSGEETTCRVLFEQQLC